MSVKQLLHHCPDWDGMIVDALDTQGEGSCCTCDRGNLSNPDTIQNLKSIYEPSFRAVPEISSEDQELFTGVEYLTAWPFPITNGVRNPDSQALLDTKQKSARIKPDLDNEPEGLF